MAVDVDNLVTAAVARINGTPALSALSGKVFFGVGAAARPFCRLGLASHTVPTRAFKGKSVHHPVIQMSVFADTLAQANALVKAINGAFEDQPLALTGQTNTVARQVGGRVLSEKPDGGSVVYHASTDIEFVVQ